MAKTKSKGREGFLFPLPITKIKIGRTTYEIVTSFNGNQSRDIKSTLMRLMMQDTKGKTA